MWKIKKEFHFSASHQLVGLREGHPCGRLHGHNYIVTICLKDDRLNANGFVQDYGELLEIKEFIDNYWDHRHLNDVFPFHLSRIHDAEVGTCPNPSAENIAMFLFNKFVEDYPKMYAVIVSETPKTTATYYGK